MAKTLKNYSGNAVKAQFGVVPLNSGLGEDDFIKITQQNENFTYKGGLDGSGTRSKTLNTYTVVEVSIMQSSDVNILLSAILNADLESDGGSGIMPFAVVDTNGTSKFICAESWIVGPPEKAYGREAELNVWKIACHDPDRIDGGN
jgi:hypothetical protein